MRVQFGRWNFDGSRISRTYIERARAMLAPFGPDDECEFADGGVHIILRAFPTDGQTAQDAEIHSTASGGLLAWNGRLDNGIEILEELGGHSNVVKINPADDLSIVIAAYNSWKTDCFRRLIGDWSISVWDPRDRTLILATDFVGIRHLYYSVQPEFVAWSSVLDPLVLLCRRALTLDEEYIAGWISSYPEPDLTPYVGINRVPPGSFIKFTSAGKVTTKYWDFDEARTIRYRTDKEYEEHFRFVFGRAVNRRLRSDRPVLAELSGGMDSTSIVCMADEYLELFGAAPRLDTVSYFSDNEPHWDEQPYFRKVEEHRGRVGLHIDVGVQSATPFENEGQIVALWPGARARSKSSELTEWMRRHGHRVVLSGTGGDEFLGGVPTPVPELENLLARGKWITLAQRLQVWALNQRRPLLHLLRDASVGFLPLTLRGSQRQQSLPNWLAPRFISRYRFASARNAERWRVFGPLPSFQENLSALAALRRQLASTELHAGYPYEKRYPFLDRDLLEFLFAIPREQIVRPGERRSLMRRAMSGIVPREILDRRRKAYVTRAPITAFALGYEALSRPKTTLLTESLGIVAADAFLLSLRDAQLGKEVQVIPLLRILAIEQWLRGLSEKGCLKGHVVETSPTILACPTSPESLSTCEAG
jgi:asparagine synthase (glutamine-hydrolysing)